MWIKQTNIIIYKYTTAGYVQIFKTDFFMYVAL